MAIFVKAPSYSQNIAGRMGLGQPDCGKPGALVVIIPRLNIPIPYDMVTHMKTTIDIAKPLLDEAKKISALEHSTLRALVEEGLREIIIKRKPAVKFRLKKASFKGNGLQKEFQGAGWDKILSAVYEGRWG